MQALYKQSHTLRHQNNVVDHIELFYQLVAWVDLNEREEQMVFCVVSKQQFKMHCHCIQSNQYLVPITVDTAFCTPYDLGPCSSMMLKF